MGQTIVRNSCQPSFADSTKLDVRISKCEGFHDFLVSRIREHGREELRKGAKN